ncbi:hypothetical protein EON83_11060 [bacterium]|nr:MAG: hypothetical protein EON83_11060 [bacterium]
MNDAIRREIEDELGPLAEKAKKAGDLSLQAALLVVRALSAAPKAKRESLLAKYVFVGGVLLNPPKSRKRR